MFSAAGYEPGFKFWAALSSGILTVMGVLAGISVMLADRGP